MTNTQSDTYGTFTKSWSCVIAELHIFNTIIPTTTQVATTTNHGARAMSPLTFKRKTS